MQCPQLRWVHWVIGPCGGKNVGKNQKVGKMWGEIRRWEIKFASSSACQGPASENDLTSSSYE